MKRLFRFIRFDPDHPEVIHCDNKQTVDLLMRERSIFQTKLRHVDIHRLWVRQEVQAKRLQIEWLNTSEMPADGLTKPLTRVKHEAFIRQIGMERVPSETSLTSSPLALPLKNWGGVLACEVSSHMTKIGSLSR